MHDDNGDFWKVHCMYGSTRKAGDVLVSFFFNSTDCVRYPCMRFISDSTFLD